MWMQGGVSEEDRLDAGEAGQLLRRTARMLRPQRRRVAGALAMVAIHVTMPSARHIR